MTILSRFQASSKVEFIVKVPQNLISDDFFRNDWNLVLQVSPLNVFVKCISYFQSEGFLVLTFWVSAMIAMSLIRWNLVKRPVAEGD